MLSASLLSTLEFLTKEIKEAREAAVWRVRSAKSDSAQVTGVADRFFNRMLELCDSTNLDYIHVSAMIHSTAVVWESSNAALTSESQHKQCRQDAQRCVSQLLPRLEAMLKHVGPQAASNTLWSFAKLGLDPDAVCPGSTAHLLHTVAENPKAATAQNVANSVWAMAALQDIRASHAEKSVTSRLCRQFMKYVCCPSQRGSATAQGVCRVLQGIVALELKVEPSTLDKASAYLVKLVQHAPAQVAAQHVSNYLLFCYKLRYMPQPARASALLAHFVSLFSVLGQEPNAQDMSNIALAVAGLGVQHVAQEVQSIASRLASSPDANSQNLCNLAWSMALLNTLDLTMFELILDTKKLRINNVVGMQHVSQLHHAHCRLEPLSKSSEQYAAWVVVKDKLEQIVGPALKAGRHTGSDALLLIIDELGLRHRRHVQLSTYMADAVLKRTDDPDRAAVLLVAESEQAYLVNHPDRSAPTVHFLACILCRDPMSYFCKHHARNGK